MSPKPPSRLKKKLPSFSIYIQRVLKQVQPNHSISRKAVNIMNSFVNDVFERIAFEASMLAKRRGRLTLSTHDIRTAVRLLLPGELSTHADGEGIKCESTYFFIKKLC